MNTGLESNHLVPENADDMYMKKRRHAIQLFLNNPEEAIQLYPELKNDLIAFFSQSSNPYYNASSNNSVAGKEQDFQRWNEVQEWAKQQSRN